MASMAFSVEAQVRGVRCITSSTRVLMTWRARARVAARARLATTAQHTRCCDPWTDAGHPACKDTDLHSANAVGWWTSS
jgi:hypothetical protein